MNAQELAIWLRDELAKVHEKLDSVQLMQSDIRTIQAEQAKDISHHIARTDALERRVEQVAEELKPVKEHVSMLKGISKFLMLAATVAGLVTAALEIFKS